jgi:ATP-dependent DNA ligase
VADDHDRKRRVVVRAPAAARCGTLPGPVPGRTTLQTPVTPPIEPMLAKLTRELPVGELLYEPKWDGFRCLLFRDGDELLLQSRNRKPLDRYFPELQGPLRDLLPERVVLDGELVVPRDGALDFDALSERIHPAASRVAMLAARTPARYVAFDLLGLGDDDLASLPFEQRRTQLERVLARVAPPLHLSPVTRDPRVASDWFRRFEGAGLDGVIAKPAAGTYAPGKRTLWKVKHQRTADVVVGGFRWHKDGEGVGSLLLGLHDDAGRLRHIGVAASFPAARRRALADELAPFRPGEGEALDHPWLDGDGTTATPRDPSRWNTGKDTSWEPLRLALVAEVAYEQLQGDRLRHGARFLRWRPDREPGSCRYDQLEAPPATELADLFAAGNDHPRDDPGNDHPRDDPESRPRGT